MADNNNTAGVPRGNRPAENAVQCTPSSLSKQAQWHGGSAAQDFLGLNEEAPAVASAPRVAAPVAEPLADDGGSWLLSGAEPEVAPAALPVKAHDYRRDAEDFDAVEPRAPAVLDASWSEGPSRKKSRKSPLLALAALSAVAAVGVVILKPELRGKSASSASQELAQASNAPSQPAIVRIEEPKSAPRASKKVSEGRRSVDRAGNSVVIQEEAGADAEPQTPPAPETTSPATMEVAATLAATLPTPAPAPEITPTPATVEAVLPVTESAAARPRFLPTNLQEPAPAPKIASANATPLAPEAPAIVVLPESGPPAPEPPPATALAQGATPDGPSAPAVEPRVRVIATTTAPLPEATNSRPAVDEHRTSVPTTVVPPVPAPETEIVAIPEGPIHPAAAGTRAGTIPPSDVILPPAPLNGVRAADTQALQTIWAEETVPLDRVEWKFKVMTPNVGDVRVTLKTKDVFEGRLYAVGENSVWLEGPYGRMGMDYARVATVEKLGATAAGGEAKSGVLALNDRVRAATPNGPVYGRVVSTDATTTKIVTDDGIKISADTKAVERVEALPKVVIKKGAPAGN